MDDPLRSERHSMSITVDWHHWGHCSAWDHVTTWK